MPPVWFEPTISAGERPQTYALDRAATGTGNKCILKVETKEQNNFCYSVRKVFYEAEVSWMPESFCQNP